MTTDAVIDQVCKEYKRFTLFEPDEPAVVKAEKHKACEYGKQLRICLDEVCQKALNHPTRLDLNEAYLICFLKFMEWRAAVPQNHRNQMGTRSHPCIWHTLEDAYLRLKRIELMLPDSVLLFPPAVLPPALPSMPLPPSLFSEIVVPSTQE